MADSSRPPGLFASHAGGVFQNLIAAAIGAALPKGLGFAWVQFLPGTPPGWLTDNILANVVGAVVLVVLWATIRMAAALIRLRRAATPKAKGDRVSIYVASFGEDETARSAWDHIVASLRKELGLAVEILPAGREFHLKSGVSLDDAAAEATKQARKLLSKKQGDLLLWGKVHRGEKTVLELRFVSASHDGADGQRFGLTEKLLLEPSFGQEMSAALAALVAVQAAPAANERGRYLVKTLLPLAARLKTLVGSLPPAIRGEDRARLWFSYAVVQSTVGEQSGDSQCLHRAVEAYREALKEWTRERVPLDWATTQNNLGIALKALGERESGTEKLEQAVEAYREALKEWTRERVPLDWAATHNNLGIALKALGERESGTEKLEQAVDAYREALKERTRERVPLDWAGVQNNLGTALTRLGERESGTEKLEQVVEAYHEALKEWTRERVPLDWAMTQNNLGTALQALGERESGTEKLEQAVDAYREALKERTRERVPLDWAGVQNNLGNALRALGQREGGTEKLEQAVGACREALKELARERVPLDWAMTQNNLGNALRALGERESGTEKLEQAVEAYREALKEFQNAPHYRATAQRNLDKTLRLLEQRRNQGSTGASAPA